MLKHKYGINTRPEWLVHKRSEFNNNKSCVVAFAVVVVIFAIVIEELNSFFGNVCIECLIFYVL